MKKMGICMKDHPAEDILEKIEEVKDMLEEAVISSLVRGLEKKNWSQAQLNELFHALKKLEKNLSEEERHEMMEKIKHYAAV